MNKLLLNINSYFNTKKIKYIFNIYIYKLYKYDLNCKSILIYLKNLFKNKVSNLRNKYNSTKSRNKYLKTYHSSSHTARKGLIWFGLRRSKIKHCTNLYNKLLLTLIFNLRSNLIIHNLEYIKFLYYIKILNNNYFKLILNNIKYINYISNSNNNNSLYKFNSNTSIVY